MSAFDEILKRHRKRIIERESATFAELLSEYGVLQKTLARQLAEIRKLIKEKRDSGEPIGPSWVYRERRLKALIDQVKTEIERFGGTVARVTTREQRAAVEIAADQVRETVSAIASDKSAGIGSMLPRRSIETAIGAMGDGSPILEYWNKNLAPAVVEKLRSEIINAVATGMSTDVLARRMMAAGDITRTRALMYARTEVNRIRREATRSIYQDNSDVITGWEWVAAKSPRTCPACLSLDGTVYELNQPFPQHINCRCTMIPVIDGVKRPKRILGSEWFEQQSDDVREQIVGKEAFAAMKRGEIKLKDLRGWATSKEFGKRVYTRSLSEAILRKEIELVPPVRDALVYVQDDARDLLNEMLGKNISDRDIATLSGALDDSDVFVAADGTAVFFRVEHPLVRSQRRVLVRDDDGDLYLYNSEFFLDPSSPRGTGTRSFAREALKAKELGIKYIKTFADGDFDEKDDPYDPRNGYYTWARLGYNRPLSDEDRRFFEKRLTEKRKIYDINDLMKTQDGRDLWLEYGERGYMIFRLDGRSKSMRALTKYLREKNVR